MSKKATYSGQLLVLYKYANLLANMDVKHALFPIINQKFFELYLSRIPIHYDDHSFQQVYGVSDKFYEYNVTVMKKIKSQLKAAESYYESEAKKHAQNDGLSYCYRNCAK